MIRKKRGKILIGLICMFMLMSYNIYKNKDVVFSMFNGNTTKIQKDEEKSVGNDSVSTSKLDEDLTPKVRSTSIALEKATSNSGEFYKLKIQLEDLCQDNGVWSIYIKDLKSQEHLSINNEKMVAASVIKLFIMAKTYQEIDSGNIEKNTEVSELLRKMITISHNEASNKLVRILGGGSHKTGMKVVNQFARSNDYLNTEQQRDMRDSRPVPVPEENYTSVEDCAKLLEEIYKNKCISPELDKEMMNLMLAQERNTKIPALIPKGIKIAHKTGELSKTENDVGIVFGTKTDYIICIMSKELKNTSEARKCISQISKVVYDLLEK